MTRVLVVDDNLFIRTLLTEMLEEGGHIVVGEAPDGVEAVSAAAQLAPDLVILDLVIPQRDGLATLESLRRDVPTLPVIICSAGLTRPRVVQALQLGARGFIAKPFTLATVLDTVESVMQEARATEASRRTAPPTASAETAQEERRSFPRVQVSLPVVLAPADAPSVSALTANVSGSGMLLTTSPLALGAVVDFALELDPGSAPITGRARAVRQEHAGQALAFEHLPLAGHVRLMQVIDRISVGRLPQPPDEA